jgi:hypothetical protein
MLSFKEAIAGVGGWSRGNFGDQKGAEALAPFAGIIEEIGEARAAFEPDEIVDGYCDQLVYLADTAARCGITDIDPEWNDEVSMSLAPSLEVALGQLAHAILKHHQGIRGFDDEEKFLAFAEAGIVNVFHAINREFNDDNDCIDRDLAEEFTRTWQKTVSKRDWVANPTTG